MWIKVKTMSDQDIFVNADRVEVIFPFVTEDGQGCNLFFKAQELPLRVKITPEQMDTLLDANSIEKCIDRLKLENMQLAQRMQYDKAFDEIYGARAKKGNEDIQNELTRKNTGI
jgi:hypothetical protein